MYFLLKKQSIWGFPIIEKSRTFIQSENEHLKFHINDKVRVHYFHEVKQNYDLNVTIIGPGFNLVGTEAYLGPDQTSMAELLC